ncbi:MAG TPA: HEAT repeat domain-containing protein, partial [Pyrinomonadaceae bacterium]|nr:HEAT repeat domain-containing protein [Pyrinomonadaceae bacterium]
MRKLTPQQWKIVRAIATSLVLLGIALTPLVAPFAQKREGPVKVTNVSSRSTGDGAVVTVAADAPLNRTQTWQDEEGFHVTLPGVGPGALKGLPRGVTVRNLGRSLEVVVAVKPGAGVTVDPHFNRLNLIVKGGVDTSQGQAQLEPPTQKQRVEEERAAQPQDYASPARQPRERRAAQQSAPAESYPTTEPDYSPRPSASQKGLAANTQSVGNLPQPTAVPTASPAVSPLPNASPAATQAPLVPATDQGVVTPGSTPQAQPAGSPSSTAADSQTDSGGLGSYIFSTTGVLACLLIGMVALLVLRKRQAKEDVVELKEEKSNEEEQVEIVSMDETPSPVVEERPKKERRRLLRRKSDRAAAKAKATENLEAEPGSVEALEKRTVVPVQPALYGAYRVDQEVGKLVLGQAHRLDVLSSRAPDDRRAIETSLLKALSSPETDEEGRRRAREALEEYGFVARQCASLLLAHNAYDRASSAHALGEIGAQASLPFLLEALYDTEGIVRTEAVSSLGFLKMPSAIGALLDMARRHPEMPASLLSNVLNACTFESLNFFDATMPDRPLLETGEGDSYAGEITHLDPSAAVEELPEWFEDDELSEALARLKESDVEARASAARRLSQFHVQRAVEALTAIVETDEESSVRAAAVTSLGEIEHESIFAPVIMAFGDEAREVRAAAARALSRMNFDRAEGYVRLIETADAETLRKVAQACIKAGMASQAIDRLISEDRRLAYEAFSLLSLLAKAGEIEPLVDAICEHAE